MPIMLTSDTVLPFHIIPREQMDFLSKGLLLFAEHLRQ